MGTFLACVAILERTLGWTPLLGWALRSLLERDLEVRINAKSSQLVPFSGGGGFWFYAPVKMHITNHSHELTYKFRFQGSELCIRRPVLGFFKYWRQEFRGCVARVIGGDPRAQLSDFMLPPQDAQEFLIEWDTIEFSDTGVRLPHQAQALLRVPMIGRIRKLERVVTTLEFDD